MTAITHVDNSAEKFGDKVSIADLAHNSFGGLAGEFNSHVDNPAEAMAILQRDWKFELESAATVGRQVTAVFKDGSKLTITANGICCSAGACPRCQPIIEEIAA